MTDRHKRDFQRSPAAVLAAVDDAADMWGGLWQPGDRGGQLTLPVVQGLRRGVVRGQLDLTPAKGGGTLLRFDVEETHLLVNRSAVFVLLLGALGGLTVVLWPLSPQILQLAPVGVVLAIVAWLMVVSRLRNSGVDDFLDLVSDLTAQPGQTESGV